MSLLDTFRQDVRLAVRAMGRSPGFAAVAVATLALGIGANSAIFSVVKAVLLAPLPYAEPDRRVMIWSRWVSFDKTWVSPGELVEYRRRSRTMQDVAAWNFTQMNLTGDGDPVRIGTGQVTANLFAALGVQPLLGRTFTPEEDVPNQDRVVVLGHGLWQRRYGADPGVVGRTLHLNGVARTILGVMPPDFRLPTDFSEGRADPTQLWVPLAIDMANLSYGSHGLYAAARLAPGATAEQATAELRTIAANFAEEGIHPRAMEFTAFAVTLQDEILGEIRPAMLLLFGAVGFLLLIACANVANLLLARAEVRWREMALRTALGAGPGRLVRQLLTESLVLSGLGAALGLALAWAGVRFVAAADPASVPRASTVTLDASVVAFTAGIAIVTGLLFSLAPAARVLKPTLTDAIKEGSQHATIGGRRQRLRALLVVTEMALAVVLVIGAGLMVRSLWALQRIQLGFEPENVLTLRVSLPQASYEEPERVVAFYQRLLDRVRPLPGVRQAGVIRSLPLANTIGDWGLDIEGYTETPESPAKGDWQVASDGAVEALGERLIRGRLFTAADTTDAQQVAVINETMARTYWPDGDPIGKRFRMGSSQSVPVTIVGIVGDVRHNGVIAIVKEKFYRPHSQFHRSTGSPMRVMTLVVKTAGDPIALANPIRDEIRRLDPNLPVSTVRPMTDVVASALSTPRFTGFLLGLFAFVALALSGVGIYGVLSYLVSQRTHEIGIRLAIGADRGQVLRMILRQGLALSAAGLIAGLAAAFVLTRLMGALLYGVEPTDAGTFLAVPVVLGVVALLASYVPALRATRVSPLIALKAE
jgi:putative ABC transport system permease protein